MGLEISFVKLSLGFYIFPVCTFWESFINRALPVYIEIFSTYLATFAIFQVRSLLPDISKLSPSTTMPVVYYLLVMIETTDSYFNSLWLRNVKVQGELMT